MLPAPRLTQAPSRARPFHNSRFIPPGKTPLSSTASCQNRPAKQYLRLGHSSTIEPRLTITPLPRDAPSDRARRPSPEGYGAGSLSTGLSDFETRPLTDEREFRAADNPYSTGVAAEINSILLSVGVSERRVTPAARLQGRRCRRQVLSQSVITMMLAARCPTPNDFEWRYDRTGASGRPLTSLLRLGVFFLVLQPLNFSLHLQRWREPRVLSLN